MVEEDALLHGEALLVVASGDAEDVALELVAHEPAVELGAHASVNQGATKEGSVTRGSAQSPVGVGAETYMYFSSSMSIFFWPPVVGSLMLN